MTGVGGIPYGYKFNSFTQRLEPDEETAWVAQKIFDYYVNHGIGYNAISTKLREEGIPTPTGKTYWKPMVIRRILRNPVYIGTVHLELHGLEIRKKTGGERLDSSRKCPSSIDRQTNV